MLNVNLGSKDSGLSDVSLANVEALANGENEDCPNGCLANGDGCWCYEWYDCEREAQW